MPLVNWEGDRTVDFERDSSPRSRGQESWLAEELKEGMGSRLCLAPGDLVNPGEAERNRALRGQEFVQASSELGRALVLDLFDS